MIVRQILLINVKITLKKNIFYKNSPPVFPQSLSVCNSLSTTHNTTLAFTNDVLAFALNEEFLLHSLNQILSKYHVQYSKVATFLDLVQMINHTILRLLSYFVSRLHMFSMFVDVPISI